MDASQKNHLKAYGIAYWVLEQQEEVEWLLNYKGGSFLMNDYENIEKECLLRGVSFSTMSESSANSIKNDIANPSVNAEVVKLLKVPKIAVYSPKTAQPWDDAVTMVLEYAEIPYDVVFDDEVLSDKLPQYNWLHLHHEDFTGQYGKFYRSYRNAAWYRDEVNRQEATARTLGFNKVSVMKRNVALEIQQFVLGGGFLFTMCSGTDSFDIALAAQDLDICESMFDGDPMSPNAANQLDYEKGMAFQNYALETDPMVYEFSQIDATEEHTKIKQLNDFFTLFDFSAKWDVVPTMLTQSHKRVIPGFMGQTTAFRRSYVRSDVTIMGESKNAQSVKYIHGELGQGQWTYYGGHDPEDYRHLVNDPPTDLNLHPNSAGYRLILNNILFPAARKKERKT